MVDPQDNINRKTAIVTGATGFIGFHLTRRLLAEGWKVRVVARSGSNVSRFDSLPCKPEVFIFDGSYDSMYAVMQGAGDAVVFHLASLILSDHKPEQIRPLVESNILFGMLLVEAMAASGLFKLINSGSYAQHYENKEYSPATLYAATKQAFEAILRYYYEATPLKVLTLKPFNVYGHDDPHPRLFSMFRDAARDNLELIMSPGEQLVDLVYIDDVVEAYVMAAQRMIKCDTASYEEYAVSSEAPVRLRDIAETYSRVSGKKLSIVWGGRPYRIREIMVPWNTGKLLPGWRPTISLEEGIRRIEEAYER